jgi:hypothetical protein
MMIPIKIECGCGQHYAFDIEPVGGRMPSTVACPACGVDGTDAANAALEQYLSAQASVAAAEAPRLHIAAHAEQTGASAQPAARRRTTLLPGQVERPQAVVEAKAKISWGDAPNDVIAYLRMQGFSAEEASSLVQEMYQERAATIRANGIRKIIVGSGLICVPIVSLLIFLSLGFIPLKIFAVTVMVGLWGAWMVFKGSFMVLAPKMESGDVAEQ